MMTRCLLSIVIVALLLSAKPSVAQTKTDTKANERNQVGKQEPEFIFLKIRHVRQKKNLCAPASASMALSHYGKRMDQLLIKRLAESVTKNPDFIGTYYVDLVNGLATRDIQWKRNPHPTTPEGFEAGLKTIRDSLYEKRPVIIDTNLAPVGHTMLVNGINPKRKLISVIDPNIPPPGLRTFTYEEFEKIWRSKTIDLRGSILTFPPAKKTRTQ